MLKGSCLCGAVAFEAMPNRPVFDCHCTQCRKQSGHFWAATSAPHSDFRLTRDDGLRWYRASPLAKRGFCGTCGSLMFWQPEGEDRISIAGGAFDGATGLTTAEVWFEKDAGDYYTPAGAKPRLAATPSRLHGRCLCGENRFSLPGPMGAVTADHSHEARKASGHYMASFAANEADVVWDARNLAEHVTPKGHRRAFCPTCATSLFSRAVDGTFRVSAGCIDHPTGGRLIGHFHVAEKGDYYDLNDGLPQVDAIGTEGIQA